MKLIILLVVLGLERYLGIGDKLRRFCYFDAYLNQVNKLLGKQPWFKGLTAAVLTILPVPLIVLLACMLLSLIAGYEMHTFVWLLVSIVVLLYCLGPKDIYRQVHSYIAAKDAGNSEKSAKIEDELLDGANSAEPHAVTRAIFWDANQSLFGVLFWFMLLGIFGAVFYRTTVMLREAAKKNNSPVADLYAAAEQIQNVLDWIPVRIFLLFFALVGQFTTSFGYWLENILSGLSDSRRIISEGGLMALGSSKSDKSEKGTRHADEYLSALSLIDRSLIIFLAIVALFTLGSWIY